VLALCVIGELNAEDLPATLTPAPPATPHVNGSGVFGVRQGSVFFYTIPATGDRPMTFSAEHLPVGLKLNVTPDASSDDESGTWSKVQASTRFWHFVKRLFCR
jgi:hypothetical protein